MGRTGESLSVPKSWTRFLAFGIYMEKSDLVPHFGKTCIFCQSYLDYFSKD